jgi:starch phosphorylase
MIERGHFSGGDRELFKPLVENLVGLDPFFVLADLADYSRAQQEVGSLWRNPARWRASSALNSSRSGFSRLIGPFGRMPKAFGRSSLYH